MHLYSEGRKATANTDILFKDEKSLKELCNNLSSFFSDVYVFTSPREVAKERR
jgi:hypothetical protein